MGEEDTSSGRQAAGKELEAENGGIEPSRRRPVPIAGYKSAAMPNRGPLSEMEWEGDHFGVQGEIHAKTTLVAT